MRIQFQLPFVIMVSVFLWAGCRPSSVNEPATAEKIANSNGVQKSIADPVMKPGPTNEPHKTAADKTAADDNESDSEHQPAGQSPIAAAPQTKPPQSTAMLILISQQHALNREYSKAIEAAVELVSREPNDARHHMTLADIYFHAGQLDASIKHYDRVIELMPQREPHLWQRGLALYLAKRFAEGVQQFETHQTVNSQDVENAVWHMLCNAQINGVEQARKQLIPISQDTRIPMDKVHQMFAGKLKPNELIESVFDESDHDQAANELPYARRSAQYYAYLYAGLYQEMIGQPKQSIEFMQKAVEVNPFPRNEVMGTVADVFLKLKNRPTDQSAEK